MNPEKFVREDEVDTDLDEVPAITPPGRLRIKEEHWGAEAPRKQKLGEEEKVRRRESVADSRQDSCKLILTAGSSTDMVPFEDAPSA
ncbi:hypothetical protein AXG93_4620s2100 [Marchantia polymorpha subsp. ruderalis]|uniref:Uncharacterized protein n=1 Tax=Marchantia polymorpha subsp. ruderalis TaxID=1480154 RepID=A0A176VYV8_MARPO|nr:hypothetical protein AXG93_4620s2100 [Marchantia polymorpha subsp. ruderalis]